MLPSASAVVAIIVVVLTASVVLQALVLVGMLLMIRRAVYRLNDLKQQYREYAEPLVDALRSLFKDTVPPLMTATQTTFDTGRIVVRCGVAFSSLYKDVRCRIKRETAPKRKACPR